MASGVSDFCKEHAIRYLSGGLDSNGLATFVFEAIPHPAYTIRGVPNGGHLSYLCVRAITEALGEDRKNAMDLFSVVTHFTKAGISSEVATLLVKESSAGRTTSMMECRLIQKNEERLRVSTVHYDSSRLVGPSLPLRLSPPELPPIEKCIPMKKYPGITQCFDAVGPEDTVRVVEIPALSGKGKDAIMDEAKKLSGIPILHGYVRLPGGQEITRESLVFFADALPPPVLAVPEFVFCWIPTSQLNVHIRATPKTDRTGYLRFLFSSRCVIGGVLECDGELWDDYGNLVAQTRQLARAIPTSKADKIAKAKM